MMAESRYGLIVVDSATGLCALAPIRLAPFTFSDAMPLGIGVRGVRAQTARTTRGVASYRQGRCTWPSSCAPSRSLAKHTALRA